MPGPGSYSAIDKSGAPAYTIASRLLYKGDTSYPGPGAYEAPHGTSPAFTIAERYKAKLNERTPGPASYKPDVNPTKHKSPAFTMRKRPFWFYLKGPRD